MRLPAPLLALLVLQIPVPQSPENPTATGAISHTQSYQPDPERCLTVLSAPAIRQTGPGTARLEMGTLDPLKTPHAERVVRLRNSSKVLLALAGVTGSCGCETLALLRNGATVQEMDLQPGEEASVRISLNTRRVSGAFSKHVWVNAKGSPRPLAAIELAGTSRELIRFTPRYLPFGPVPAGTSRSVLLTASVDASLLAGKPLPPLRSSSPAIMVTPEGAERSSTRDGRPQVEQTYRVTLTTRAPAGLQLCVLTYAAPVAEARTASRPAQSDVEAVLASVNVQATADVRGTISVSPSVILFGSARASRPAAWKVTVNGSTAASLNVLTASASHPSLLTALSDTEPAAAGGSGFQRTLTVRLKPTAPTGPITTQVVLSSPTGQKVMVTVVGEVVK